MTSAAGNSSADKLRDLHERGRYWLGLSIGTNADRARDAGNEAWGLLPEIAAVIEAAEKSLRYHNMDDRFAEEAYTQTHNALAALSAALAGREGSDDA